MGAHTDTDTDTHNLHLSFSSFRSGVWDFLIPGVEGIISPRYGQSAGITGFPLPNVHNLHDHSPYWVESNNVTFSPLTQ